MRIAQVFFLSYFIIFMPACSKKSNSATATALPVASINNVSEERATTAIVFHFSVSLDKAPATDATIHYTTIAATAEENKDYKPLLGTVTIPSGQKQANVDVEITGDSTRKANQVFYVQLDNPKNCTLGTVSKGTGTIINENGLYFPVDNAGYTTPGVYPGYSMVWSDEFTGNSVNSANWSFEGGNNNGWGNSELENYTSRTQNAFVSQGNLIIEARKENYQGNNYTSARMITMGHRAFTFGRIDIRANYPKAKVYGPHCGFLEVILMQQAGLPVEK